MERLEPAGGTPGAPASTSSPTSTERAASSTAREAPVPDLPGYDVARLLGSGGSGDVWLVRDKATGERLAAKVIRPAARGDRGDPALAARRELRILRSHAHPHLLAFRDVVACEGPRDGIVAVLSEYAAGGSLARLVGVRRRLTVGETVTTIGPIAQALAALHAEGTSHGDVSPGNILFSAHGKPLLADFGAAQMVADPAGERAGTRGFADIRDDTADDATRRNADVFGLGAVAWFCLTGEAPPPTAERPPLTLLVEEAPSELALAIEAALAEVPRERPTASELARAVFRSARAQPVDLAPAVDDDVLAELVTRVQPETSRRRFGWRLRRGLRHPRFAKHGHDGARRRDPGFLRSRGLRVPASRGARVALAVSAFVAAIGLWWTAAVILPAEDPGGDAASRAGHSWSRLPDSLRGRAESTDPVQAVQALAEIRGLAVSGSDRELLRRVNVPGSEAARADAALLDELAAQGRRLAGFTARVVEAQREDSDSPPGHIAVVRVRVVSSGYAVLGDDGRELTAPGAGKDQVLRVVVERDGGPWRVARILAT
ncbi:serine/threonine-protein kinase [Sinomonas sp. ASV322]|uniref:serine/threonine-protein kinase n=1 Tax=Sinomonas sp. ASV322 TaxID=3041920 RepID=UPI0027DB22BA|nr:serine/threonine-protein kinase [Sinomonas sp. ASV322]MDQ4500837.1 serine/threonine-protein kinase [Sinomonas sp. ASV322]